MSEKRKLLVVFDMALFEGFNGGAQPEIFQKESPELGLEVEVARFDGMVVEVRAPEEKGKIWLKNGRNQQDLEIIYMRATSGSELATLLGRVAEVDFFPKFYVNDVYVPSKAVQACNLARENVPIIPTVIGYGAGLVNYIEKNPDLWTGETIVKPSQGAKGKGVQKAVNRVELVEILKARVGEFLVWQPLVKNAGEGRCLVLGGEVKWTAWRDGETRKLEEWEAEEEVKELALRAAAANGLELAGVDVIFDEVAWEWRVLEVNTAPGFRTFDAVTGEKTDELMMRYFLETKERG